MAEDEMVRWHHQPNGHEFEQLQETVMDRGAGSTVLYGVAKRHDFTTEQQLRLNLIQLYLSWNKATKLCCVNIGLM